MSIISNHRPEVIQAVNAAAQEGERPEPWDQPAAHYDPDEDIRLVGPVARLWDEPADTVTVNREALEAYQAAHDRLWGFLDGLCHELDVTVGPCTVERLSQLLRRKLDEMDQVAKAWSRDKHAV
jgi:hypothetical protein